MLLPGRRCPPSRREGALNVARPLGRRLTIVLATLLGAGAIALALLAAARPPARSAGSEAAAALAREAAVPRVVARALGKLESASEEIPVASDITGRIQEIFVEEGERVKADQPLARLEETLFRARVEAAEAAVRAARARRERLQAGARPEEIRRARAALEAAEAQALRARERSRRMELLLEEGVFSRDEAQWAAREAEGLEAQSRAAREDVALAEQATRSEDLQAAVAELERAERELEAARAELAKTVLRSPICGTVVRRSLRVGEAVSSFQIEPIVSVADLTRLRVRAEVDEIDIGLVRLGQEAYAESEAFPDVKLRGKVVRLGKTMGRKTVKSQDPNERQDVRVREVLMELEEAPDLPLGLRVSVCFLQ